MPGPLGQDALRVLRTKPVVQKPIVVKVFLRPICSLSDVVRRTYPERIRAAVRIVTKSPGGDPVIDLGKMLKNNFADIAWMSAGPMFSGRGGGGGGVNPALLRLVWSLQR